MDNEITEVTRRAIFDLFTASDISWAGRIDEDNFLSRIFDLTALPSTDSRFKNAAGDIHQHRIRNYDWDDDWVFYDSRFSLLWVEDEVFLKFLAETLHPVVRSDGAAVEILCDLINHQLSNDGWQLIEGGKISGRTRYVPIRIGQKAVVFHAPTGWQKVDRQFQAVRERLDSANNEEDYQSVGLLCREVLISVSQEVYDEKKHPSTDGIIPSQTDAKRMLEAIVNSELPGKANQEARSHAKAAVSLALALQHKRTANFRMAALCAEATSSVINLLAIFDNRRGRIY